MRISDLLTREPFDRIIEQTLKRFWESQYNQSFEIVWQSGNPKRGKSPTSNSQQWLCNFYLNAIFKPDANSFVFEPVIKEFSRSRAVWKRPLQKGYVLCSLNRLTSSRFAHASLNVSPSIPDSQGLLIVAGNHKIRILDRSKGLSYGILKSESPSWFIQKEINVRQEAARLGIPVPKLHSYANDKTWFKEEYVIGTPMNRLADYRQTEKLLHEAGKSLLMLINETLKEQLLSDYIEDLITKIGQNLQHNHLLSDKIKKETLDNVNILATQIKNMQLQMGNRILTAIVHGDFHPANILQSESGLVLIDWEYSCYRQAAYDPLVFTLRTRFPGQLAQRLKRFVEYEPEYNIFQSFSWPGLDWKTANHRMFHVNILILEELSLNLQENANPIFFAPGRGLVSLLQEISEWIKTFE